MPAARPRRAWRDGGVEPGTPPVERVPVAAATPAAETSHGLDLARNLDLLVLLLALPIFLLVGAPISGYIVAAAAWLVGRFGMEMAIRRRTRALAAGNRKAALGVTAWATMGRLWLIAGAILLVGLLDEREAGLAAAVLTLALVTANLGASFFVHVLDPEGEGTAR